MVDLRGPAGVAAKVNTRSILYQQLHHSDVNNKQTLTLLRIYVIKQL